MLQNVNFATAFWTPDRRAILQLWAGALKLAVPDPDNLHTFLANEIKRIGLGGHTDGAFRALRTQSSRFVKATEKPPRLDRKTRNRGSATDFCTKVLLVFMNARSSAALTFRNATNALPGNAGNHLANEFMQFCKSSDVDLGQLDWTKKSQRDKMRIYARTQGMVGGEDPVEEMIHNMIKFLEIEHQHADIDQVIFSRSDTGELKIPLVRSFLVFRNTSDPDRVLRMFAQFQSKSIDWPWTMFRVFHSPDESVKPIETHGAIIGGKQAVYLMGPFGGLELNVLAVSAASVGQPCFTGLQIGPDGLGVINATRLVFKEAAVHDSKRAGTRLVSRKEAAEVLGSELARSLRNEVDVYRPDVRQAGGSHGMLGRKALANVVAAQLKSPDGKDALLCGGDRPFNPADEAQLPFSTAIEMLVRPYSRR